MCRVAGYVGDSKEDLGKLVIGLREAAHRDTTSGRLVVHGDGWGYAIYSRRGISFYKTAKPIFEDKITLPETEGRIYAIFHARKASPGYKAETRSSHPFFGETRDSYVFFAHNGTLDKEKLRKLTGFVRDAIDSELAFRYALQRGLFRAASELEEHVKPNSALNLLVLEVNKNGGARVLVKNYYNRDASKSDETWYYKILEETMSGGKAVFSSTFNDYGFSGSDLGRKELVPVSTTTSRR